MADLKIDEPRAISRDGTPEEPAKSTDFAVAVVVQEYTRFQRFTTATIAPYGQSFQPSVLSHLVASGRGLVLATLGSGEARIETKGKGLPFRPADIAILPLSAKAVLSCDDGEVDCLVIDELLRPLLPAGLDDETPLVLSALEAGTSLLYQQLVSFRTYAHLMQRQDAEDLLPPLLMMLSTIIKRQSGGPNIATNSQLDRVRGYIRKHLLDPDLDPTAVAKELGLSRARLYRLAEPLGGITKYIRDQRLQLAHEKLARGEVASITALAFDLGFGTEAAFRRAFKEAFGVTPRQVKRGQ